MKHWILSLVFMFIAIFCGFEFGKEIMKVEKNWMTLILFGAICITATIFYLKERAKRTAYFKERMEKSKEENKK